MKAAFGRMKLLVAVLLCSLWATISSVSAATSWTDWTSATAGAPGSAAGTLNGVGVTYSGELDAAVTNGGSAIWAPNTSFIGGASTASPSTVGDAMFLNGSFTGTNTITFASPIDNPLIAIWSLGAPGFAASFTFNVTPTVEAGGPNSQFGGTSVTVLGNVVSGREGNGVVQFGGTFSSLSWTNTPENFYAFTVGTAGPIPEPSAYLMLLAGLGLLGFVIRRRAACTAA